MSCTLHGSPISTRVRVSAALIGAKVDVDAVKEFTDIYKPEWTEHQPFNQMPYLVDNENKFEIYESRAIAKYLAVKAKSPLVPSQNDLEAYANFEKACSIEQSNFDPSASGLAGQLVFGKFRGVEPDMKRVGEMKETLAKRLDGYERILSKTKYLAGNSLTLADVFHLPYGTMAVKLEVAPALTDFEGHPNVARWWKSISELPEWKQVLG